jgi:rhodanese-related sulfurtransferase
MFDSSRIRKSALCSILAASMGAGVVAAHADVTILVNPGDQGEQSRASVLTSWKSAVEQGLRKQRVPDLAASPISPFDMTADLSAVRARVPDVVVGPSHLIGSAVRYGYTPVVMVDQPSRAVMVAMTSSDIGSFEQSAGKRLGLPEQDSLVTYLIRGEATAANTTLKRQFSSIYQTRFQDALLICLQLRRCDVVAVERVVFDRWVAAGHPVKVIMESHEAPGMSVAVKDDLKLNVDGLRSAIAEAMPGTVGAKPAAVTRDNFTYVSTLGYFTPRALANAKVVDANTVASMLRGKQGRYIDTRNKAEFNEGHVPGATLIPYVEKSSKDPDFDAAVDEFHVARLGADKGALLIFGCNGAECWKSHKASIAAIKAGYTNVAWFRGGVPEWRSAGLPIETGDPLAANP